MWIFVLAYSATLRSHPLILINRHQLRYNDLPDLPYDGYFLSATSSNPSNMRWWIPPKLSSLCLNARQPDKVLNRLNARQSEIFTEFPLKDSFKLLNDIWCFFRNAERFQNLCSFARWRNNRACAYYKISMCLTLRKFTLTSAVRDI